MPILLKRVVLLQPKSTVSLYYYSLLITKTYKHYGKIYQSLHRFQLKHIFGREMDKDILIEFLNNLLEGEHTRSHGLENHEQ